MKNYYVVSFVFTRDYEYVWLIEKQKPDWQKGCLNGIGGKIEEKESSFHAAHREIEEEAGVPIGGIVLDEVGSLSGKNNDGTDFQVVVFTGTTDLELKTQEEEKIFRIPVGLIKDKKRIENVPALIELCLYKLTGSSHFDEFRMKY